jgi:hypothetical protein
MKGSMSTGTALMVFTRQPATQYVPGRTLSSTFRILGGET